MINCNIGMVETCYGLRVISNKCQLFCTREQSAGGKRGGMVCESLNMYINNDTMKYEIKREIYVSIMDNVCLSMLLISTESS